ncbi:MAG TPA: GAF domain-containing protein [Sphingomonas sp.]|uniref:GAF domain-containing protein n=1 Tax=Sphingomonas sp. TaxID=28214 RepID=UPI002C1FC341|nr:GAF domain-containing protein [Sphingomonas sp.]HMI18095.1 GAF domain-containing protein [Sphingomonas sp.]
MSLSFFSPAPRPTDERERQRAVDASGVLRAPPDPALHQLVAKAAQLLDAPMAALSIIDRDRMWFAARVGIDAPETSRAISFCAHAILKPEEPLVIADAASDERFAGNPFVQNEPGVRFYVGMPVLGTDGHPLGALCILDVRPREGVLPLAQLARLAERAGQAIAEIHQSEGVGVWTAARGSATG